MVNTSNIFSDPGAFFGQIGGLVSNGLSTAAQLKIAQEIQKTNAGQYDVQINPDGTYTVGQTNIMGGAGLASIWKSTDMLFIGVAAVAVLTVFMLKK